MKPTTPTKAKGRTAIAEVFACFGILLFFLVFQTLISRCILLSNETLRENIQKNADITEETLNAYNDVSKSALKWRPTAEIMDDLASTTLLEIQRAPKESQNALKEALAWETYSLARAPANSYAWTRLAYLHLMAGNTPIAAAALSLSLETGPYEPEIMLTRVSMAIAMLDKMSEDTKARIPSMLRTAWEVNPEQLAEAAKREKFISMVEEALQNDPASLTQFRDLTANNQTSGNKN